MAQWCLRSAVEQARAIRAGQVTSSALVEAYIERIERLDGPVNTVVVRLFDTARTRAREADAALKRGEAWGPLHGVPVTIKESFMVKGARTTCGIKELKDHVPESNAVAVQSLVDAGVVILGKTNVPAYTSDHQSFNEIYGRTVNPHDQSRTPGGSSGGSAAALACGFSALELGSDIGGSIRIPAHFCGVCGHKPSQGIGHMFGHVSLATGPANHRDFAPRKKLVPPVRSRLDPAFGMHNLAVSGPMGRCCADLEVAMRLLAKPEPAMARSGWSFTLPPAKCTEPSALRCAAWFEQAGVPTDKDYLGLLNATADALQAAGATVERSARPFTPEEVKKHMQTFAGVLDMQMGGSRKWSYNEHMGLSVKRNFVKEQWEEFFQEYDVLLCPVLPIPAYPHSSLPLGKRTYVGEGIPEFGEGNMMLWPGLVIVADLPSTVVPVGRTPAGLPCGMQIVAAPFQDLTSIEVGKILERAHSACRYAPPPGFGATAKL